jgi:hypothetical protein
MPRRWYGRTRERCAYCKQPQGWLCDFRGDDGESCRRPMCFWHRQIDGGEDRCREHAPAADFPIAERPVQPDEGSPS